MTYAERLSSVANEAAMVINAYKGKRVVHSPTGEDYIHCTHKDNHVFVVIGGNEPIIRNCVEQKIREDYANRKVEFDDKFSTDTFMLDDWDYEEICSLADELMAEIYSSL